MAGKGARAGDLVRGPASLPGPRAGAEGLPNCRTELYPTCHRAIPSPQRCTSIVVTSAFRVSGARPATVSPGARRRMRGAVALGGAEIGGCP